MKQTELAKRLGVSVTALSAWECGLYAPTRENIRKMAIIFGVKPVTLYAEIYATERE